VISVLDLDQIGRPGVLREEKNYPEDYKNVFRNGKLTKAENSVENGKSVIHEEKADEHGQLGESENLAEVHFPGGGLLIPDHQVNGQ